MLPDGLFRLVKSIVWPAAVVKEQPELESGRLQMGWTKTASANPLPAMYEVMALISCV